MSDLYAASMIDGRTVMEVDPNGRSADEIRQLWTYMNDHLEKNFRRTVFAAPLPTQGNYGAVRPMGGGFGRRIAGQRSEEHTSELQSLMRISYAVFGLKKKRRK